MEYRVTLSRHIFDTATITEAPKTKRYSLEDEEAALGRPSLRLPSNNLNVNLET